jgi:hypothetical protein
MAKLIHSTETFNSNNLSTKNPAQTSLKFSQVTSEEKPATNSLAVAPCTVKQNVIA